jgi:DNA-binding transcriptional MerR regulator
MSKYSMAQVETLTGIKAHTLRKWEERYSFLKPERTETNIRYYSDDILRKLLNISILVRNGYRVSVIDQMQEQEINDKVTEIVSVATDGFEDVVDALVASMIHMEEKEFNAIFRHQVVRQGLLSTFTNIIYPFLRQVGILWGTSKVLPAQEHYVTGLIRQKLISAIDSISPPKVGAPKLLLFLPEGELHELGLLISSFIAQQIGWQVYYLGQNVPLENIPEAIDITRADALMTILTSPRAGSSKELLDLILADNDVPFLISGQSPIVDKFLPDQRVVLLTGPEDLIRFLENFKKV